MMRFLIFNYGNFGSYGNFGNPQSSFWLCFRYAVSLTPQKCPVYLSFSQEEFMPALTRAAATAGAFAVVLVFAVIGLSVPASGQG